MHRLTAFPERAVMLAGLAAGAVLLASLFGASVEDEALAGLQTCGADCQATMTDCVVACESDGPCVAACSGAMTTCLAVCADGGPPKPPPPPPRTIPTDAGDAGDAAMDAAPSGKPTDAGPSDAGSTDGGAKKRPPKDASARD